MKQPVCHGHRVSRMDLIRNFNRGHLYFQTMKTFYLVHCAMSLSVVQVN